jgi:hypothetical protein
MDMNDLTYIQNLLIAFLCGFFAAPTVAIIVGSIYFSGHMAQKWIGVKEVKIKSIDALNTQAIPSALTK